MHVFPYPLEAILKLLTHNTGAVSLSWQLFDLWRRVLGSLGKAYAMIWKVTPAATHLHPVMFDWKNSGPVHAKP
jgi:hypothetical protein